LVVRGILRVGTGYIYLSLFEGLGFLCELRLFWRGEEFGGRRRGEKGRATVRVALMLC